MKSRIDQRTVFAVTLGCPKNRVDTEVMLGDMLSSNYALVDSPGEADVVIVNTCGFLHAAREESLQALKDVSNEMRPGARLVAAGCMIGRFGDLIEAAVPSVSLMVDTLDFNAISKRLEGLPPPPGAFPTSADPRLVTTGSYAYLKVADGCDRRCSFCIIPSIKGGQRSRPIRDLLVEAGALV
ncbi:MAG TPA: 30S ribosomal protein S12 methylthiotransferase RimO, partial [Myxococcota bacterium]|nr:30S ribosomal protein S12 methylthiotransferase RimO [Myxococcota bacterium]